MLRDSCRSVEQVRDGKEDRSADSFVCLAMISASTCKMSATRWRCRESRNDRMGEGREAPLLFSSALNMSAREPWIVCLRRQKLISASEVSISIGVGVIGLGDRVDSTMCWDNRL